MHRKKTSRRKRELEFWSHRRPQVHWFIAHYLLLRTWVDRRWTWVDCLDAFAKFTRKNCTVCQPFVGLNFTGNRNRIDSSPVVYECPALYLFFSYNSTCTNIFLFTGWDTAITVNSVENRNHAVIWVFLADHIIVCSTIGYHSTSELFLFRFVNGVVVNKFNDKRQKSLHHDFSPFYITQIFCDGQVTLFCTWSWHGRIGHSLLMPKFTLWWHGSLMGGLNLSWWTVIPMTRVPETGTINRFHFLAPVSGTCVKQIWDRICLVPDSGAD